MRSEFRAFGAALSSGRRVQKGTQGKSLFKVKTSDNEFNTKKVFSRGVQKGYISEKTFK